MLIFDNATGVGRRIGDVIHEAELFSRFRAHYHFRVRFCNPYSGWEKGNVERKVDYNRANLFVPVPHFSDDVQYNHKLLLKHERKASELHYKKQVPICELFEEDRKALLMLPPKPFNVCRYEWLKADGYGKVCMDGKHFYSTRPENANQKTPDVLRTYMDAQPKEKLKDCLRIMNELTNQYGFQAAASAMEMACVRGTINICDASVLAARITGYGITTPPETGPSLEIYDEAFLKGGSKAL